MGIEVVGKKKKIDRNQELRDFAGLPKKSNELLAAEKETARTKQLIDAHEKKKAEKELTRQRRRGTSAPYGSI
tara:strand:+ start:274 stop:492 length:219 start_codon:yes stop_codon:yes gene_type:complete